MSDLKFQFPIIRNTFPSQVRSKLAQEWPIIPKPTNRRLKVEFIFGFYLTGGHYHEFIKGFGFNPYGLEFRIGINFYHKQKDSIFAICYVQATWFKSKNMLLPSGWASQSTAYIELRQKLTHGINIVKGWLK
jgi:hypothetical protein